MANELQWLLDDLAEEPEEINLLKEYYEKITNGPMGLYRSIIQGGNKQGQNYFVHVLDGINIVHKLRTGHIIEMSDTEEKALFCAYTIHDINKIPPYGGWDVSSSYSNVATAENIRTELRRLHMELFWDEYEQYIEDIRLLMLLHQKLAAPLEDLDRSQHTYTLRYERLLELGKLLYAVDNLDLSHTLTLNNHLQTFVDQVNTIADRHWRWIIHRIGENRGVFTNIVHNTVVKYIQRRHEYQNRTVAIDLLYCPDGVAYLLPAHEDFRWTDEDTNAVGTLLAQSIIEKQAASLHQFIQANQLGIRVSQAAIDSGAAYQDIMYAILARVDKKIYSQAWLDGYNQKLLGDIQAAAKHSDKAIADLAQMLSGTTKELVPLDQEQLKRGELTLAYRNLLHDHLRKQLKETKQFDAWTYIYHLLHLPAEKYALYEQVDHYRRHYFIALDCKDSVETLFERFLADLMELVGEQAGNEVDDQAFREYLEINLTVQMTEKNRDFKAFLQRYQKDRNKQCCMCSSASATTKLMDADVPNHMGVQIFSNRLKGGGGEPKRNVCPICRIQLIMEKLTRISFKKGKENYTNFYLHLFPYSFFPAPYLNAMYSTLKGIVHEGNQCFFLKRNQYYQRFNENFELQLQRSLNKQTAQENLKTEHLFEGQATIINGISVPPFAEAISNTPTLPLNAPGDNYTHQFLFALTHALMVADFFGCRVSLSRTPFPLLSSEYMVERKLAFFVDEVPLNLRWLLPANEYRSLETYREGPPAMKGGQAYITRKHHWARERLDEHECAAFENISKRVSLLYQVAQQLRLGPEDSEAFLVEAAMAMADDPFSLYRVVDLAIEKLIREHPATQNAAQKNAKGSKKVSITYDHKMTPEQLAIILTQRVAPLLERIVKE